jgi:beta-lactamase superfamily II metal-dependent hydrolase
MFRLELLPAYEGDCLVLSWGDSGSPHRILIDAGRAGTADAVREYSKCNGLGPNAFELFIITHIDRDHIGGAVPLLDDSVFRPLVKEIWFNSRSDLDYEPTSDFETYGALDGERITTLIGEHRIPSNIPFKSAPVAIQDDTLPFFILPGDLTVTIFSPDQSQLATLAKPWDDTVEKAPEGWEDFGEAEAIDVAFLARTPFRPDRSKPNASSIAIAAEFEGRHILLSADAHVRRLEQSLALYKQQYPEFAGFSLVKASHHGSRGSVSLDLVQALNCRFWAISTDSSGHSRHPDQEAIARIIAGAPRDLTIAFNYETEQTSFWRRPLRGDYSVQPIYGQNGYIAFDIPQSS